MAPEAAPRRFFHGWIVVWAAFTVMLVGFGGAYSFSAFFAPLQESFDASRGRLSLAFSIAGALWFILGAVSGPLADRFGPRGVVALGIGIVGAGLLLASQAQALWQVYFGYGLGVGVGVGFSYVPSIGAVQRWFVRRRGFASGVAVSGIGAGTLLAPPFAVWLIDLLGWRGAYAALGVIVLAAGGIAAYLVESDPHRRGLAPDGDPFDHDEPRPAATGLRLVEAIRTRPFVVLYLASLCCSVGLFIPFVHLAPYAEDRGIGHGFAVALISLVGIGSIAGRFLLGGVADRFGRRRSVGAMFLGMGVAMLWWLVSSAAWQLVLFALFFGTCYGGFVALAPALCVDYFGGRSASGIIGTLYTAVAGGTLAGPTLAGVAFDLLRSYEIPILASAASMFLATLAVALMGPPPLHPPYRNETQATPPRRSTLS
ncbi:MAG TPA: MFS transporter [Stellaceae bacterium]|nr:MFS transporter [Stellaceae bacterium]